MIPFSLLLMKLLKQMFGAKVEIEVVGGPKQDCTMDCGLFAIATCVSLASDVTLPTKFDQSTMRIKAPCRVF